MVFLVLATYFSNLSNPTDVNGTRTVAQWVYESLGDAFSSGAGLLLIILFTNLVIPSTWRADIADLKKDDSFI